MSSELKPGDRALVVWMSLIWCKHRIGDTVLVLSAPTWEPPEGAHPAGYYCRVRYDSDGTEGKTLRERLSRIPPDDEAKRLFRETEKPVAA